MAFRAWRPQPLTCTDDQVSWPETTLDVVFPILKAQSQLSVSSFLMSRGQCLSQGGSVSSTMPGPPMACDSVPTGEPDEPLKERDIQ